MINNTFEEIAKVINDGEVFLIFPHISVDGDALGSSTALCQAIRSKGKKSFVVLEDEIPNNLKFLDEDFCLHVDDINFVHDVSICVDCSETSRFPKRKELFQKAETTVCIDHHRTAEPFCCYNYIDATAAATAELIFEQILAMDVEIDEDMAMRIFAGIATDTGNFRYSNTTKKTHQIVTNLYDVRDHFDDVCVNIYENDSFERLALQGEILSTAEIFAEGRGIVASVTQQMLEKTKAKMEDSDGVVASLRAIAGVEIATLLKEKKDGSIKVSMRAKSYGDVATICQKYDGGGHTKAAGFTSNESLDKVVELIKKEVEESFN